MQGISGFIRVSLAGLIFAVILGGVGPASANPFGGPGPGNYAANNGTHEIYRSIYLSANIYNDTGYVVSYVVNPHPDIYAYISTTYSSIDDAQVYEGNYGDTGWYGGSPCAIGATYGGSGDGEYCKPRWVTLNTGYYPGAFDRGSERRHFICHELGHTLGLYHDYVGYCMDIVGVSYTYSSHNWNHLYFY